jgi:hypothetical protein
METLHAIPDSVNDTLRLPAAGNLVWDAGFESWKCELHRYTDQEVRLDRCARAGDRLRIEAVRATEERFSVAYTVCPPDCDRPKCLTLVSSEFAHWDLAVNCAKERARAFVCDMQNNPQQAVLGHWNAYHIIDDEAELQAWQWDGESVFELKRQTLLLDCFPERLAQYEPNIPAELVTPQALRGIASASSDGFCLNVVAADKQGFALLQTTWCSANGYCPGPEYVALSVRAATAMMKRYWRQFLRAHALHDLAQTAGRLT